MQFLSGHCAWRGFLHGGRAVAPGFVAGVRRLVGIPHGLVAALYSGGARACLGSAITPVVSTRTFAMFYETVSVGLPCTSAAVIPVQGVVSSGSLGVRRLLRSLRRLLRHLCKQWLGLARACARCDGCTLRLRWWFARRRRLSAGCVVEGLVLDVMAHPSWSRCRSRSLK